MRFKNEHIHFRQVSVTSCDGQSELVEDCAVANSHRVGGCFFDL